MMFPSRIISRLWVVNKLSLCTCLPYIFILGTFVHSVSVYVMLLTVWSVCCFILGSLCGGPECFSWSGILLYGGSHHACSW
jgi:hypothetical protein